MHRRRVGGGVGRREGERHGSGRVRVHVGVGVGDQVRGGARELLALAGRANLGDDDEGPLDEGKLDGGTGAVDPITLMLVEHQ